MTLQNIEDCLRAEISYQTYAEEQGFSYSAFVQYMRKFDMVITYRMSELSNEIEEYLSRNDMKKFASDLGINLETTYHMRKTGRVSYRMMIKLLNFFQVNYKIEFKKAHSKKIWDDYPINLPSQRAYKYRHNKGEKDTVSVKLYSHLLTQFNRKLQMLMDEKNIGELTQNRINDIVADIVKEAIQVGIHSERNKTDDKVLKAIVGAVKQNKIIEFKRESL